MAYPPVAKNSISDKFISILENLIFYCRISLAIVVFFICLLFHSLWRLLRLPTPWPRIFLRSVTLIGGARVKTTGQRLKHDVFYVANHISWFDIPVISGITACAFIAHDGIAGWPVIGWLARLNKTIFVSRTERMKVSDQITIIREAIEEKYPITVFPEGTTTDGSHLLPFKPSLFAAMAPPPKPIMVQPIFINYHAASPDIAWIGEEAVGANAKRLWSRLRPFPVTLEFLEPFDPSIYGDRKAICAEAQRRVSAALSASLGGAPNV